MREHIQHVQRINAAGKLTGTVHAEDSPGVTFCSWVFLSGATRQGHAISRAADVDKPLDCTRCADAMRTQVFKRLREFAPKDIEAFFRRV